ncbi:trans-2,3-dihydro-3-hydroxyanthranilate isomerase [Marmoricola sp. OAE513]|uniref:PhzF family phenazine biosynthesis protein n=1 Tax=Marmoricola sp. OAE513 TaxID=2817894 RepID=UPI001AE60B79
MTGTFLAYDVVDVFAEAPFAGNQLAVVHGAADLDDAAMLAIAREFNYSETTFPVPVDGGRYRVRIFTLDGEVPFAGHPTLGTAWVLRERGELPEDAVVQECGAGDIGVQFAHGNVELTAAPRDLAGPLAEDLVDPLLAELGLTHEDRVGDAWIAGTGLTFVHLPVTDAAIARARVGRTHVRELADLPATTDPLEGINLYAARTSSAGADVHSRVFVLGIEDPATGSAAAGLGMALVARGLLADGGRYRIHQGVELGRPSVLLGSADVVDGRATTLRVAGQVHHVARGEIRQP